MIKWAAQTFSRKFSEAWTACMVCMTQGDLSVISVNHVVTASRTGALAAVAFMVTSKLTVVGTKWAATWLTGVLTMTADIVAHPTHFGEQWVEAACTGLGAATICFLIERKYHER